MKNVIVLTAIAAVAGTANAQIATGSTRTYADNANNGDSNFFGQTLGSGVTATFRSSGVREPNNGARFLNAQNTGSSSFDSWAAIRWDLTDFYAEVNAAVAATPGATGFEITSVDLELLQSPFSFSGATNVDGYLISDDALDFDPQTQAGSYASSGGPDIDFNLFAGPESLAATWFYDDNGGTDVIDISTAEALADLNDIADNFFTFAFEATDSGNASYRGSSAFNGPTSPALNISYNIIPAPGAAAFLGLAGIAGLRRRRA